MCNGAWATCSTGRQQSPISITTANAIVDVNKPVTTLKFKSVFATAFNRSGLPIIDVATPSFEPYMSGGPTGGSHYLSTITVHSPSEHAFDNFRASASVQFWFRDANHQPTVVLDLMFIDNTEETNPFVDKLITAMRSNSTTLDLNPVGAFPTDLTYYFYPGSDATPPCTEGWTWMILRNPMPITLAQVSALRGWQGADRIRPLQSLNGRNVTLEYAHIIVEEDPNTFVALISVFALLAIVGGILAIVVNRQANEVIEKRRQERVAYLASHRHQ
jgi:carbonic anhydrase